MVTCPTTGARLRGPEYERDGTSDPLWAWVAGLKWIIRDATPAQSRALFHDNAVAFYGLE